MCILELIWAVLRGNARARWERLYDYDDMETSTPSAWELGDGEAKGKAEGKAEEAGVVLTVLRARGIDVPDEVRTRAGLWRCRAVRGHG